MNLFHRAALYVARKLAKTFLLFLILLAIFTLALSGFAIKGGTETAALNVRQALGGVFTLKQNTADQSKWVQTQVESADGEISGTRMHYAGAPLSVALAEQIMAQTEGLRGYNATYTSYCVPLAEDGTILRLIESPVSNAGLAAFMAEKDDGDFKSRVSTIAATDTAFDSYFMGGYIELVQGRHFTHRDKNPAIISTALAESNGLEIGDRITLRMSEHTAMIEGIDAEETAVDVTIVGLFRTKMESTSVFSNTSMENAVFTTMEVIKATKPNLVNDSFEAISFYVEDPGELRHIVQEVNRLPDLDPTDFIVSVDSSEVDAVMQPLTNMGRLITVLIVLVLVVGAAVLCLVLSIRVKEREQESGIQLALGIGKAGIVGQYLVEVLLIAVLAFSLSIVTSGFLAKTVGDQLLDYSDSTPAAEPDIPGIHMDELTITDGSEKLPQFHGNHPLTRIEVEVEPTMILGMFGVGVLMIFGAVFLAAAPVLRRNPREILSKMS